jgi:hypothetical protein
LAEGMQQMGGHVTVEFSGKPRGILGPFEIVKQQASLLDKFPDRNPIPVVSDFLHVCYSYACRWRFACDMQYAV